MSRSASIVLLTALLLLAFGSQCKKAATGGTDRLQPLPLIELQWGESLAASAAVLTKKGWEKGPGSTAGEAHFIFQAPEVDTKDMPGTNPYEITLFSREDRLVAARYIRRDVPATLDAYQSGFLKTNELKAAWEGSEKSTTTPAGNTISEQTSILENAEFLVKSTRTKNTGAEEKFAAGLNDEVESQIYAIKHNEGISADALKASAQ